MDVDRYRRVMTEPIAAPTYTPPVIGPPIRRRRKRWPWIAGSLSLVAVLVAVGFLVIGGGGLTIRGTVTIGDSLSAALNPSTATCAGEAVSDGDQVVITASNGDTLALGHLGSSSRDTSGLIGACEWSFSVDGVEKNRGPYSVEVGSHGKVVFTQDEAAKTLDLTINSG